MMNVKKKILTVSSANMDFVMNIQKLPVAGQTLSDPGTYAFVPGGKGANSAVTVSRLGGASVFCTRLGNDANGERLRSIYLSEGIDPRFILTDPEASTGLASIMVEPSGQNRIIVFPGSNARVCEKDVASALLCRPDALLMHLEIPRETVLAAARLAAAKTIPVFLDAGPADPSFPLEQLPELCVFSPNETETKAFTGIYPDNPDTCLTAAIALARRVRAKYYVIKLGERGCYVYDGKYYSCVPGYSVPVVDTTAAGDVFTAALTLEYLRSGDIVRAARFGNVAGALSVCVAGALPSLPTSAAVEDFMEQKGIRL